MNSIKGGRSPIYTWTPCGISTCMSWWLRGPRPHLDFLSTHVDAMIMSHGELEFPRACHHDWGGHDHVPWWLHTSSENRSMQYLRQPCKQTTPVRDPFFHPLDPYVMTSLNYWFHLPFNHGSLSSSRASIRCPSSNLKCCSWEYATTCSCDEFLLLPVLPLHHWFCNVMKSCVGPTWIRSISLHDIELKFSAHCQNNTMLLGKSLFLLSAAFKNDLFESSVILGDICRPHLLHSIHG